MLLIEIIWTVAAVGLIAVFISREFSAQAPSCFHCGTYLKSADMVSCAYCLEVDHA